MPINSYPVKSTSRTKHVKELTRVHNKLRKINVSFYLSPVLSGDIWECICILEREIKRAAMGTTKP